MQNDEAKVFSQTFQAYLKGFVPAEDHKGSHCLSTSTQSNKVLLQKGFHRFGSATIPQRYHFANSPHLHLPSIPTVSKELQLPCSEDGENSTRKTIHVFLIFSHGSGQLGMGRSAAGSWGPAENPPCHAMGTAPCTMLAAHLRTAPSLSHNFWHPVTPLPALWRSVPSEKARTRLGPRAWLPTDMVWMGDVSTGQGASCRTSLSPRGRCPLQQGWLSGAAAHLSHLSSLLSHLPMPLLHLFYYYYYYLQPKGKEREGNLSTTIACQAPIISKPSSPLPFSSPYLA